VDDDIMGQAQEVTIFQVIEALTAVIELHEKTPGNNCGECYMPGPCRTIEAMKEKFQ
jgi:hypothetical protein